MPRVKVCHEALNNYSISTAKWAYWAVLVFFSEAEEESCYSILCSSSPTAKSTLTSSITACVDSSSTQERSTLQHIMSLQEGLSNKQQQGHWPLSIPLPTCHLWQESMLFEHSQLDSFFPPDTRPSLTQADIFFSPTSCSSLYCTTTHDNTTHLLLLLLLLLHLKIYSTHDSDPFCSLDMPDSFWCSTCGWSSHHMETTHCCWGWPYIDNLKLHLETMKITLACSWYDQFGYDGLDGTCHNSLHQWSDNIFIQIDFLAALLFFMTI